MDYGIGGRVAVVTGGTHGIGLATARTFLDLGARVAICGRDPQRLEQARVALGAGPDRLLATTCDVLDPAQVQRLRDAVADSFGGADMLINNAGQARLGNMEQTEDQEWMDEYQLKIFSVLHPTRAFRSLLAESGQGAVVNINSLVSQRPHPHMAATSAARAGQLNMSKTMSLWLAADRIRVNSVLVGLVKSGQWERRFQKQDKFATYQEYLDDLVAQRKVPLGRFGESEEVARTIAFLASPGAGYITGSWIDVTGGMKPHV
ncbi:3-oxoacyl-[acyl-carrier-protein] reductase FabG [Pigmentiphaga humi]|uniref:3-oxoacyl-[acyl-carrier-protein] reductase FabG n=1 Tax=Pigmentiphaga humi TaxID=2478468 RepID=A0A3P4B3S9_9BURK|nr:SDR family oxidoreductase [Pigmentiphaga humi]VCU70953.1 3-oxoacyl-[acyl-carrier-protein] reductase FabG [Pigmentiphaga humi]